MRRVLSCSRWLDRLGEFTLKKFVAVAIAAVACGGYLTFDDGVAGAAGTAPSTTTSVSASVTATSANIEGAITPDGSAISSASFCYGTSSTLVSCTSAPLASSAYSALGTGSTNDPVYVSVSGLTPGTTYYYSLQATNANGSGTSSTPYGSFTTAAAGAFSCTASFYQISGYSSGGLYNYDVSGNSFTRIGSGSVAGLNGLGYDTANNYLYAVAGSTLYQINNDGQYTSLGTVSGLTQSTGGDFYDGQLLETGGSGLNFESVNVTSKTESAFTLTNHAVGSIPGASSWAASDITVQGNYAYGLSTSSSGTTLYVANLASRYLASIPVTGIPSTTSGTYAYGAAYSDAGGNAYFYNNTTNIMYEISSSALQAAIASNTDPAGTAIGSGASSPGLNSPNDGATCPNAASPYAPSVNPPTTGAAGVTTAGVSGVVSPNGATLSAVNFCYSTGADVATVGGALSDSPTCDPVDQATYPFTTWTGANLYNVGVSLSGLSGCTTYYYQSEAVNSDGTAYSSVTSFTTGGCQTVSFSSNATNAIAGGSYTPTGSATSALTPAITVDPSATGVCSISAGVVSFDTSGSCVLDINQPGNSSYAPAPQVQQTITVSSAPQTVQFTSTTPTSAVFSGTYTPTGTASSGLTPLITVDPSATGVCSISAGVVAFNTTGSCVLDINQSGNSAYAPAPQTQQTITVSTEPQNVQFTSPAPTNATVGDIYTPTGSASSNLTPALTVDPSSNGACSIGGGVVTFNSIGSCVLDINQSGNGSYAQAQQQQQSITVAGDSQNVQFTSNAPTGAVVGDTYTPTGTATSGLAPVTTVDSSATGVCSISAGTVTLNASGSCVLDINQAGNGSYDPASQVQQTITVVGDPQSVQFTSNAPTSATVGDTYTPTGSADSGLTPAITVDSSATGVCSMSGGMVTFNAPGSCVLDIDQNGNGTYAAASQLQQTISVDAQTTPAGPASQTVLFTSNAPTDPTVGDTYTPTGSADSGLTPAITVDSSATSVCSISAGVVRFDASGSCVLDMNQPGNSSYDPAAQVQQTISVAATPQNSSSPGSPSPSAPSQSTPSPGTSSKGTSSKGTPSKGTPSKGTPSKGTPSKGSSSSPTVAAPIITSVTVGNGQAVVSWTPSATHKAKVVSYMVSTAGGSKTCETSTTSCLVTDLTNGRAYTFTVTAITTVGKVKSTKTSKGVKPSAAPTVPAKDSIQVPHDAGRVVSANGTVTRVAFTEHGWEISVGNKSVGLSLQLAAGSVHYAHSVVSVVAGAKARIGGYGFLPGSTVTLYVASDRTKLGTARVRQNGTYEGIYKIPSSLKSGYHTVISAGIVYNKTRKSVEGSVQVISKQLLDVVPFEFNESTLTPRLAAVIKSDASTIALGGFRHVTITAYTDPRGAWGYNIGLSQRRAGTVATKLKADLSALGMPNTEITIVALGKSNPVTSKGYVHDPASRRAIITV
jgi:outer membrane protein OmpA-like peptidoglycan-associated protein